MYIGSSDSDIQCNIALNGNVVIYGSFSVANSKCWIFTAYEDNVANYTLTIVGDGSSRNIRGEIEPLCITESAELYSNAPINVNSNTDESMCGMNVLFDSKFYDSNMTGLTITGTFTDGAIRCIHSTIRGKFSLANAIAPVSFAAHDSIVQSINAVESQTILPYQNLFTGGNLHVIS